MKLTRRESLAALITLGVASGCNFSPAATWTPARASPADGSSNKPAPGSGMALLDQFTPEDFGATGDGQTNDTEAFQRMSEAVNANGGGTIILSKTTYIVGAHRADPDSLYAFPPADIMKFQGCSRPLTIMGNGARLRCADGLRYGTFDRATGLPTHHPMPYVEYGENASPYVGMLNIRDCTATVVVRDLELDGNCQGLTIGGTFGDTGWQIPAMGLWLWNNTGGEQLENIHTHHHGQDGMYLTAASDRTASTYVKNVISEYNARQGCTVGGGANYSFVDCKFNHTGRAGLVSAPAAGFDIEAEQNPIRNLDFTGCEFSNNVGLGMGADSGDSEGAKFDNCRFIGTDCYAAWPRKPFFTFSNCLFVGMIVQTYRDSDNPEKAAKFVGCTFCDDPALSPTGQVYGGFIADLGAGDQNVLFDNCRFDVRHKALLPYTAKCIYNNCTMFQASDELSFPRGTYTGTNTIVGNVSVVGYSTVMGQLTVNGQLVPRTDGVSSDPVANRPVVTSPYVLSPSETDGLFGTG